MIAGASRYRDDPNRDPQFTKHASTWLNAGCWDDEPLPPRRSSNPAQDRWDTARDVVARLEAEEAGQQPMRLMIGGAQ